MSLVQYSSLLGASILRRHGPIERISDFFLVVDSVSGYGSRFLLRVLRFCLRHAAGLRVRYSRQLVRGRCFKVVRRYSHGNGSLFLATQRFKELSFFVSFGLRRFRRLYSFLFSLSSKGFSRLRSVPCIFHRVRVQGGDVVLGCDVCVPFVEERFYRVLAVSPCASAIYLFRADGGARHDDLATSK